MKFINKLFLGLMLAPVMMFTSCVDDNKNDNDYEGTMMSAFATLNAKSATGMSFITSEYLGSDTVTYTTPIYPEFEGEIGKRYVIFFSRENTSTNPFISGRVDLIRLIEPFTADVQYGALDEITKMMPTDAYCMYIHGAFNQMDVTYFAPISQKPVVFAPFVDEATADNEFPDIYLCYQPDLAMNVQQTFFGTFNLSSLLTRPGCHGFTVYFRANNGSVYKQKFTTDGREPGVAVLAE